MMNDVITGNQVGESSIVMVWQLIIIINKLERICNSKKERGIDKKKCDLLIHGEWIINKNKRLSTEVRGFTCEISPGEKIGMNIVVRMSAMEKQQKF